jgi:two-component system OmpR family response regulator
MRLLLVEDDRGVAEFLQAGLRTERYQIDTLQGGEETFGLGLHESRYDVILLDVILPGLSGIELCLRWRQRGVQTPILMLSGKSTVDDRVRGLNSGADDYLSKPFAFEELLARIKAILRRHHEFQLEAPLQAGDLTLDPGTREARRGGRELALTPTEFALLEHLMRRSDRAVSRTVIEEQVWGTRHDRMTNVVDVYIRRVRKKIGDGTPPRLIHTVRGFGYRFRASS